MKSPSPSMTLQPDPLPALSQLGVGTSDAAFTELTSTRLTGSGRRTSIPSQESPRYASATLPSDLYARRDPGEITRHGAESSSSYPFLPQPLPVEGDYRLLAPPTISFAQPPSVAPPTPAVVSSSQRTTPMSMMSTDANKGTSISSEATQTQALRPNTQTSSLSGGSTHLLRDSRKVSVGPFPDGAAPTRHTASTIPISMRSGTGTEIDWIVPVGEKLHRERTIGERLDPTLVTAIAEKNKYASKARLTGYALNAAIGLQVFFGSLTTALSVVTKGKQTAVMTAVLGGLSTIVAAYLARARGSNEPELSISRVKDLEQFIRECEAFKMDHGHCGGRELEKDLERLRGRFEELLGNANGERKLSPPV